MKMIQILFVAAFLSSAGLGNAQERANVTLYLLQNGGGPPLPAPPAAEPVEGEAPTDGAGPAVEPGADAAGAVAMPAQTAE